MWLVLEKKGLSKALAKLPRDVKMRYEKWKDIVTVSGPAGLREIKGFHDEALRGQWRGHRSSRLGNQYRIIYSVEAQDLLVLIIDITAHDYRKK